MKAYKTSDVLILFHSFTDLFFGCEAIPEHAAPPNPAQRRAESPCRKPVFFILKFVIKVVISCRLRPLALLRAADCFFLRDAILDQEYYKPQPHPNRSMPAEDVSNISTSMNNL